MSRYVSIRNGGDTNEEGFLKFLSFLFHYGVATGWLVAQRAAGANLSVDVPIGAGSVPAAGNYPYFSWSDAAENVTISPADPSNPRRDLIVAYVDLSVVSNTTTNNVNALCFRAVTGTAATTPVDPTTTMIQTAVGGTNPYIVIGRLRLPAAATNVVTAYIDDLRAPMAMESGYLWGGPSNTKGHLVPNQADGTVVTTTDTASVGAQVLGTGAITLGYAQIVTAITGITATSPVQVPGLTATVQIPPGGRRIKITAFSTNLDNSTVPNNGCVWSVWDGPVGTGTQIGQANVIPAVNAFAEAVAVVTPSAGPKTYNVGFQVVTSGTGIVGAAATGPAFILVEAI